MNEFKGTKGKWRVDIRENVNGTCNHFIVPCNVTEETHIAELVRFAPYAIPEDIINANAQLIAAAPELLKRLESVQLMLMAHPDYVCEEEGEFHDQVDFIQEVINKALGKENPK